MNYNKNIVFITEEDEKYNPETSEYESVLNKKSKRANVTDLGTDRSKALFGDIKQGAKVIRLKRPYNSPWDYIEYEGKTYNIITHRDARLRAGFIVQEVIKDGKA